MRLNNSYKNNILCLAKKDIIDHKENEFDNESYSSHDEEAEWALFCDCHEFFFIWLLAAGDEVLRRFEEIF